MLHCALAAAINPKSSFWGARRWILNFGGGNFAGYAEVRLSIGLKAETEKLYIMEFRCPHCPHAPALATEDPKGYLAAKFYGGLEMAERDKIGERLSTMLQQAAASAEGQTEVTLRNPQDKAQREAIEAQRKAAKASIASAKAAEKAAVAMERNAKLMLWSVIFAVISAIASAVSAYYSYWSAVHPR
jgi:hypothetical protein